MATLLTLGIGFSDAPDKVQPTLNDCLVAVIEHAEFLMEEVIDGLMVARQPTGVRSNPALQELATRRAIDALQRKSDEASADFRGEFSRIVYEGGAAQAAATSVLRFEDLKLLDAVELERNIEVARATQELVLAVEDMLPPLDAYVSTLLGWRTIQPELNPLRPDVFVRALQTVLGWHVPDEKVREALITPAAGMLGANLRRIYRELSDWLRNSGVEAAVPAGGLVTRRGFFNATPAQESLSRTLLTLERLRLLMTGGFDREASREGSSDFLHTVPASMALLQELKQVDSFVNRLTQRARSRAGDAAARAARDPAAQARLGRQLGEEVVRQMFENLAQDRRLLPGYQARLRKIEPAVIKLARNDSRFFSDPQHPARRLLDQLTERSLGYKTDADEGCARFLATAETAVRWLETDTVDADVFRELLEYLEAEWARQDRQVHDRREKESKVLLRTEQRNLLIEGYVKEFAAACRRRPVPDFVAELLVEVWPRVVAEARLNCSDGSEDPGGYHALARELIWSVQKKKDPPPARTRRLAVMIPGLLTQLRSGLASIDFPPARTDQLFDRLITVHQAALQEGRDASPQSAAALAAGDNVVDAAVQWLSEHDSVHPREGSESGAHDTMAGDDDRVVGAAGAAALRPGAWVDLMVDAQWLRVQLTWASPGATLFMFISPAGTAHSMSRRTLERLRQQGLMRVVADRSLVQEALDGVATAALANTFPPRA